MSGEFRDAVYGVGDDSGHYSEIEVGRALGLPDDFLFDESPEDQIIARLDAQKFIKLISENLTKREFKILVGYSVQEKTMDELGNEFNLSSDRIRQIFSIACRKIRILSREKGFEFLQKSPSVNFPPREIHPDNLSDSVHNLGSDAVSSEQDSEYPGQETFKRLMVAVVSEPDEE